MLHQLSVRNKLFAIITGVSLLVFTFFAFWGCAGLQETQQSYYSYQPSLDSTHWIRLSPKQRRDTILLNAHPPFREESYQQWTLDNNNDFVCGITFYVFKSSGDHGHYSYEMVGRKMKIIKGSPGIVEGIHNTAKANPSQTVKVGVEGKPDGDRPHDETSFQSALTDTLRIKRRDMETGQMKTEKTVDRKHIDGFQIHHESLFENEAGTIIDRLNYISVLSKRYDENGNYLGYAEPLYAFPFAVPFRSADPSNSTHPFSKKSVKWGVQMSHKILHGEQSASLQLAESSFESISEGSTPSLGMELQRAREKGAMKLYHSFACNQTIKTTYDRSEIDGYIIRQIFYYNQQEEQGEVTITKVGVLQEKKDKAGNLTGFKQLFWADFLD